MKITKVEPLHVGQFMFVRVETDGGITGCGEAGIWGHVKAAGTAIERFAEYLVGRRAFDIEHHWNVMHRFSYFQGLAINSAISASGIALRDIKGKALGVPIHGVLGGPASTRARIYGHIYESTSTATSTRARSRRCWRSAGARWRLASTPSATSTPSSTRETTR